MFNSDSYKVNGQEITVWRINNDINGNPRFVIHFLDVLEDSQKGGNQYSNAVKIIHSIGGRKYNAKWFGGGLVFSSYNVRRDLERIIPNKEKKED